MLFWLPEQEVYVCDILICVCYNIMVCVCFCLILNNIKNESNNYLTLNNNSFKVVK